MSSHKVSYVVVCWNNQALLKECFDSINQQVYQNKEIILVDNNSEDDSVHFVETHYPTVKIIKNSENFGFARANNIGIEMALDNGAQYVALINTDATLDESWTRLLVNFSLKKPNTACVQGTTLDYYDHQVIDSTHIYISANGSATQGSWREYYSGERGPVKVFGVNAAAAMYTKQFIEEQPHRQLFDESLFMYLEDVDVALRSTVGGWDNYLVPNARAYHMGSASSKKQPKSFSLYYTYRNNLPILVKNLPLSLLVKILPRALKGDYLTIKHLIKIDSKEKIPALLKGRLIGFIRMPIYIFKRLRVKKNISTDYLWALMNRGL